MNNVSPIRSASAWVAVCHTADLVDFSGVSALVAGQQVALFSLPGQQPSLYALDNFCPVSQANVLSRGIVGDLQGELVVASPLYKEHFRLRDGQCLENDTRVRTWPVQVQGDTVMVMPPS